MTGLNVVITLEPNAASGNLVYNTGHLLKGKTKDNLKLKSKN